MLSTIKPSNSTKRTKKPKPLFHIFHPNQNQENTNNKNSTCSPASSTSPSLGSGSSVPLSSMVTSPTKTRASPMSSPSRGRQRSKSVGRPSDQRSLARQQSFNKLCGGDDTHPPPPLPPMPSLIPPTPKKTISTPTRRLRKYASAHDLEKAHQKEYQELHANNHVPLPTSPLYPRHHQYNSSRKHANNNDDDDDIPLADAMRRLPSTNGGNPPSPALRHQRHNHRQNITSPIISPTRPIHYHQPPTSPSQQQQPYYHPNSSLLNDDQEDDDEDLVPIARLKIADHNNDHNKSTSFLKSAADKYKEKVKERLLMDDPPQFR